MSVKGHTDVNRALEAARETITVKSVFGEAYEQGGVTVIPAASVSGGGGGGGEGEDTEGKQGRWEPPPPCQDQSIAIPPRRPSRTELDSRAA